MDFEQKYKDALRRAKKLYGQGTITECLGWVFPEIKESKDEKNIKDLIDELKCSLRAANCQNDACGGGHEKRIALLEWGIAWLEKQGEQRQLHLQEMLHWISVEDELPKKDGKYLFYDEILGVQASIYYDGCTLTNSITHWMALPQPPKEGGEQ